jgi:uncharacterized protein YjbI with pentapeptide repeats
MGWRVLWAVGMVVALLTTALLTVNLYPGIWKGLLEERNLTLIAIGVSVTAIVVMLAIGGASLGWTGFGDKTFWDWLQLLSALAIPVVIAAAGLWFTAQQEARQQEIETDRAQQAQEIENKRSQAERELAVQRAQDEALQAYLNQMSSLLLEKALRTSKEDSEVRTLARARTLTVLGRLDPTRKTALMQFLVEADLVQRVNGRDPIISLRGADLNNVDLPEDAILPGVVLSQANLSDADLRFAWLSNANLYDADLSNAYLRWVTLSNATLRFAKLSDAHLPSANLRNAMLSGANLSSADLTYANLRAGRLGVANLSHANLSHANLSEANLSHADLSGADLSNADLRGADLGDARGVSNEALEQQAKSLEGATMPNGQKYEDWLKDRENRQQDE